MEPVGTLWALGSEEEGEEEEEGGGGGRSDEALVSTAGDVGRVLVVHMKGGRTRKRLRLIA